MRQRKTKRAIKNALLIAARYARTHVNDIIVRELEANPPPAVDNGK